MSDIGNVVKVSVLVMGLVCLLVGTTRADDDTDDALCDSQPILTGQGLATLQTLSASNDNPVFSPEGLRSVFEILDWGASEKARDRIADYYLEYGENAVPTEQPFRLSDCAWRHVDEAGESSFSGLSMDLLLFRGDATPLPDVVQRAGDRERPTELHTIPEEGFSEWLLELNDSIADSTGGRIEEALNLDPATQFAVSNVLVFDAPWLIPFDTVKTDTGAFTLASGDVTAVQMMSTEERSLLVAEDDRFIRVLLLYADNDHYMHLVLPKVDGGAKLAADDEGDGDLPEELGEDALADDDIEAAFSEADSWLALVDAGTLGLRLTPSALSEDATINWDGGVERAVLFLPRFNVSGKINVAEHMKATGHGYLFSDASAFSALTGAPLLLSQVTQNVNLRTDEKGSEAGVVTTAATIRSANQSVAREIRFDRPFLYVIGQASTGALIAMGIVDNPGAMESPK